MNQILGAMAIHADRYSAHLNKKKADLQRAIKELEDAGQPIPEELVAALKVDEDIEGGKNMAQMTNDVLTGKLKLPEGPVPDFESKIKSKPTQTMSVQKYSDDSLNGQLTRDLNAEMANRPDLKVFVPQVFGWDSYKPFDDFKAEVAQEDATTTSPAKPLGINRNVELDVMPKLKVAKEWALKVSVSSPTAHREWLATDSECGSKESKAKLNNLLRELFELEKSVSLYFAKCHPTTDKHTKVIQSGIMASLMPPASVRQSVQDIVMNHLRLQLKNLHALYKKGSLRMWGSPMPYNAPEDDSGDDESSAEEEDLDKEPVMSVVFTPFGAKYLQGGPKRK